MLVNPGAYIYAQPQPQPAPPPAPPPVVTPPTPSVDAVSTGFDLKQITDQLYGKPIPVSLGGRRRMGGYICWGPRLRYTAAGDRLWSFAVSFGFAADPDGIRNVLEIRFDSTVVYSALTNVITPWLKWRFYPGTETQNPDPLATLMQGTAATAFRGQMVIFFEDVPSQTIPFVGALIADRVSGGLTAHYFDTPTTSAIRSVGAFDWAAGIMYTSGRETSYRLIAHRLSDRSQIFDVPITNLDINFVELEEISFLWCPEAQAILAMADDGGGLYAYMVTLDPDSGAILHRTAAPTGHTIFGGFTYYADTTATDGTTVVIASVDVFVYNTIHIDFYTRTGGFGFHYVSPNNLGGLGSGGNVTAVIRVPDGEKSARFLVSQGAVLVLAKVNVADQEVTLSTAYTASAVINNLYGDPIDKGVVLFLSDGTAVKLDAGYAEMWTATPGFTAPPPGSVGNEICLTDAYRKSQQTFAIYAGGGIFYMNLIDGTAFFEPDVSTSSHGGHQVWDAATNILYVTDNGDPEAFLNGGTSDDTIPIALALTKLAQFWGYTADEFEVVDVPGDWIAVIVAYDTTFQDLLKVLQSIYPWDIIQTDKLRVIQRDLGTTLVPVGTITANEIKGSDSGDTASFLTTIAEDVEQPAINELQFIDPERDYNWQVARYRQPREPVAVTSSVSTQQIKIPIVMKLDDAKMLVAAKSYRDRVARCTHAFTGMPATFKYEPGDILTVDTGLRTIDAAKVTSTDAGSDWSIQFQLESLLATGPLYDPSFWLTGVLPTDSGTPPATTEVDTDGSEFVVYLDVPLLSGGDTHDWASSYMQVKYTIATRSDSFALRYAAFFFTSLYGWSRWFYFPVTAVPLYGTLAVNLGNTATPFMTDFKNVLTFRRVCGDASVLQALSYEDLMNSVQMFAVGRPGRWEIIGAGLTMTTNADGTITLKGLTRGRRGSEVFCGSHVVGDQVVCLQQMTSGNLVSAAIGNAGLPTPRDQLSPYLGQQQQYASAMPVTYGGLGYTGGISASFAVGGGGYQLGAQMSSTITGNAERCYAPVHLDAVIVGSDIQINWDRRDRLDSSHGGGADIPMSEVAELYDVVILDGPDVRRTYTNVGPPPFTYPDADITADWGGMPAALRYQVYQKSALTGRGFAAGALTGTSGIGPDSDPYWSNVVLLASFNGVNNATSFTAETGQVLTFGSGAKLTNTPTPPSGVDVTCLLGHNTSASSFPSNANLDLSLSNSDQFVIEWWQYLPSIGPNYQLIQFGYNTFGFMCRTFNGTGFEFYFITSSGASASWSQTAAGGVAATWQAMAIAKSSAGALSFYVDGVRKATTTPADSTFKATTGASPFYLNPGFAGGDAFMSWLRVSKGTDRGYNGASYAVPMLPLPHHA